MIPNTETKLCYGKMFPNPRSVAEESKKDGRVFSLVRAGPAGMIRLPPRVELDRQKWAECVQCPAFDHCYKLSMAKLALETAVSTL